MNYKVVVISLIRRQDRRDKITKQFNEHGIPFEFYDAIDGETLDVTQEIEDLFKGNDYDKYGIIKSNLYAANLTHLKIMNECAAQELPYFIFEDDVKILKEIDFRFEDIANMNLDAYWLTRNEPSILAYVIWPKGAIKMHDWVINTAKLDKGLDWKFLELRYKNLLNISEINDDYFYQIPGHDSDIAINGY